MHTSYDKTAILLVNLGTPENLEERTIRAFLKEFLLDQRVVERQSLGAKLRWQLILNAFILPSRPAKTKKAYEKIWRKDENLSPLYYYTQKQAQKLDMLLKQQDYAHVTVDYAMRYGNPSIEDKIHALQQQGYNRMVIVPLYPQYCASTTATVHDGVFRCLLKMRFQPHVEFVQPYYDHPTYIDALKESIQAHLSAEEFEADAILVSYHGIPQSYHDAGDPYMNHCFETSAVLQAQLPKMTIFTAFQSRFGKAAWIRPYTDGLLEQLPSQGIKNLAVVCPGFASDCIETLEEINMEGRACFLEAGGEKFTMVPCLNDQDIHIKLLADLVKTKL